MNPSTALATVLVDELARQGVREAVLCPGSRSAPLAYALQQADREGRIRLHVRVDERSAGFLALGLAKLTRRPVPVCTTSGTAVANLHPAVLEADHAAVPLLVLSADRPPELRGTGANQTTDQLSLFGPALRWSHDLGAPERRAGQQAVWRSVAARACAAARGLPSGDAGPVQLNLPLREPLVPGRGESEPWPEGLDGRLGGAPWVRLDAAAGDQVAGGGDLVAVGGLAPVPRTLVVLGDLPEPGLAAQAVAFAASAGWPVVAEPFGLVDRTAVVPHGPLLLTAADWLGAHLPERVLVVGRVTLSRPVGALLRDPAVTVEVVTPRSSWADPGQVARAVHGWGVLRGDPIVHAAETDAEWAEAWWDGGARVAKAAASLVTGSWPSGLAVADALVAALPPGALLFVGSSNPARDLDLALSAARAPQDLTVVASRGLAGIDGSVSTAVGLALASPDRPAYALMGDLTFLHDTNGLLVGRREPQPDLTVVVPNDDGGGIFTLLEPGEPLSGNDLARREEFERVFGTPTGASIVDLCRAHGARHTLARAAEDLRAAVGSRPAGIHVVEVSVERDGHRDLHARLRAAAAEALG